MLIIDKRAPHSDRRLLSAGLAVWVVCVLGLGVFLPRAAAHPLGNYSINQYLLLAGRLRGNRALSVCADRLLLAIRFGRLQYGLWLIVSFSLGLALVLVAIGLLVVFASDRLGRFTGEGSKLLAVLPVFSSAMITILGFWVVIWTLLQYNVIIFTPGV